MTLKEIKNSAGVVFLEIHEGLTYEDGAPRATLTVQIYPPFLDKKSQVSWPSTSDQRPELALALSKALVIAADIAKELDKEKGE